MFPFCRRSLLEDARRVIQSQRDKIADLEEQVDRNIRPELRGVASALAHSADQLCKQIKDAPKPEFRSGMSIGEADAIIVIDADGVEVVIAPDKITHLRFVRLSRDAVDGAEIFIVGRERPVVIPLAFNDGLIPMLGKRVFDFRRRDLRGQAGRVNVGAPKRNQ